MKRRHKQQANLSARYAANCHKSRTRHRDKKPLVFCKLFRRNAKLPLCVSPVTATSVPSESKTSTSPVPNCVDDQPSTHPSTPSIDATIRRHHHKHQGDFHVSAPLCHPHHRRHRSHPGHRHYHSPNLTTHQLLLHFDIVYPSRTSGSISFPGQIRRRAQPNFRCILSQHIYDSYLSTVKVPSHYHQVLRSIHQRLTSQFSPSQSCHPNHRSHRSHRPSSAIEAIEAIEAITIGAIEEALGPSAIEASKPSKPTQLSQPSALNEASHSCHRHQHGCPFSVSRRHFHSRHQHIPLRIQRNQRRLRSERGMSTNEADVFTTAILQPATLEPHQEAVIRLSDTSFAVEPISSFTTNSFLVIPAAILPTIL